MSKIKNVDRIKKTFKLFYVLFFQSGQQGFNFRQNLVNFRNSCFEIQDAGKCIKHKTKNTFFPIVLKLQH